MSKTTRQRRLAFFDVDTQVDFMAPKGKLYVRGARLLGPRIRRLVRLAAERGILLFSSVDAHAEDDPEFGAFPGHCVVGTPGQEKIRGTLLDGHIVVPSKPMLRKSKLGGLLAHPQIILEKQSYDVFDNRNAERVLAASGATRFVVFGVATDYCVRAAVLGLRRCGYAVTVVEDAIAGVAPNTTEAALADMRAAGAKFRTTDQVVERPAG